MRGDVDAAKAVYKGTIPLDAQDIAEIIVFNRTCPTTVVFLAAE
jgi:NADP-dependent 3-hydroxy acid dehydrogenase YdfG